VGLERRFDSTTAGRVRPFRRPSLMRVSFIAFPPPRAQERGRAHVAVTLFHCPKFDAAARVSLSHCLRNLTTPLRLISKKTLSFTSLGIPVGSADGFTEMLVRTGKTRGEEGTNET